MTAMTRARPLVIDSHRDASVCLTCGARAFSVCNVIDDADLDRLSAASMTVSVQPGHTFIQEGDPAEHFFNVTAGTAKLYKLLPDGRRQITGFLFPGDFLGLTHNALYAYSAEAMTATRLCRFPRKKLEALLDELPKLEQRLLGMASHELAAAQDQMVLLGRKSARERVVSFLLMLSGGAVRRGQPDNPVAVPMTRNDIADFLGLTVETVSRTMTQLKTQHLIELMDEKQVRLSRIEALREIAGGF